MGCGASRLDLKETGKNTEIKLVSRRREKPIASDDYGAEEETESSASNGGRKSVSSPANDKGLLKRVFGSEREKERVSISSNNYHGCCTSNPDVKLVRPKDVENPVAEEELDPSTSIGRRSLSLLGSERGFLKRVFGNEHGGDQGRKSVSSSPMMMENGLFAKENGSFVCCKNRDSHMIMRDDSSSLDRWAKSSSIRWRSSVEEAQRLSVDMAREAEVNSSNVVDEDKASSGEERPRERSLLFPPGSPSFRIYCVIDKDIITNEDDVNLVEGKQDMDRHEEGPARQKKGRRANLLMNVLQRGGSVGMRSFLYGSSYRRSSSVSQEKMIA